MIANHIKASTTALHGLAATPIRVHPPWTTAPERSVDSNEMYPEITEHLQRVPVNVAEEPRAQFSLLDRIYA